MASQNPEIAEALAFFRAKKYAYASPMDVARALGEGSTAIHVVDVRNPVAPIPTIIKGAVWIPEREIACRLDELPRDRTIVLVLLGRMVHVHATSAAIPLLENGFVAKELNGGASRHGKRCIYVRGVAERRAAAIVRPAKAGLPNRARSAAYTLRQVPLDQRAHVAERESVMTPGMVSGRGNGRNQAGREGATFGATVPAFKRVWRVQCAGTAHVDAGCNLALPP